MTGIDDKPPATLTLTGTRRQLIKEGLLDGGKKVKKQYHSQMGRDKEVSQYAGPGLQKDSYRIPVSPQVTRLMIHHGY